MRTRFTKQFLAGLVKPGRYWDRDCPGLGIRVSAGGIRSWVIRYRPGDKWMETALGRVDLYPDIDAMRDEARERLQNARQGFDPTRDRITTDDNPFFTDLTAAYRREVVDKTPEWAPDYRSLVLHYLGVIDAWLGRYRLSELTRDEIERWHAVNREHPAKANQTIKALKQLWSWRQGRLPQAAASYEKLFSRFKLFRQPKREQVVDANGYRRLMAAMPTVQAHPADLIAIELAMMIRGARLSRLAPKRRTCSCSPSRPMPHLRTTF